MEDIYSIDQVTPAEQTYPILLTPDNAGGYIITAPDFPAVNFYAPTIEEGLANAPEALCTAMLSMVYPPAATDLNSIKTEYGQFAFQIAV